MKFHLSRAVVAVGLGASLWFGSLSALAAPQQTKDQTQSSTTQTQSTKQDQQSPRRRVGLLGDGGDDRVQAAIHVDAVVAVADGGVKLAQCIALGRDDTRGLGEPGGGGGVIEGLGHAACSLERLTL